MRTVRLLTVSHSAWGGSAHPQTKNPWADPPPLHLWTEFLTHTCENITFPQLLYLLNPETVADLGGAPMVAPKAPKDWISWVFLGKFGKTIGLFGAPCC